ncbi:hypothetical protein LOD99_771 [Oopsacas minuta]|uniref:Uncharacterized protein n=1 Tax=Oopsacas minuta TaxID=111878 RepID=A0AAV7JZI7_9METZ|nr:hypothetical protein LOD99_771 [Oopsacas minuta]
MTQMDIDRSLLEPISKGNIIHVGNENGEISEQLPETEQTVKDEDQKLITMYVHNALEKFLPSYDIDPFKDEEGRELYCSPFIAVMEVVKNNCIKLYPDLTGKFLTYSIQPPNYVLHVCINKANSQIVKFAYESTNRTNAGYDLSITAPFHTNNSAEGQPVLCDATYISSVLTGQDPISSILNALSKIHSDGSINNGFDGKDFDWYMDGNNLLNFAVSNSPQMNLFWEDDNLIENLQGSNVKLTGNSAKRVQLALKEV